MPGTGGAGPDRRQPAGLAIYRRHRRRAAPETGRDLPQYQLYRQQTARYDASSLTPEQVATLMKVRESSDYLADHMQDAPVLLVPCMMGRVDGKSSREQAGFWGSILPAVWSFMLAARERGLGTAWTTIHLFYEQEAAEVLGIPYEQVTQAALIPVAYTLGTDFKPAPRKPLDAILHFDRW